MISLAFRQGIFVRYAANSKNANGEQTQLEEHFHEIFFSTLRRQKVRNVRNWRVQIREYRP